MSDAKKTPEKLPEAIKEPERITVKEFFEKVHPGKSVAIKDMANQAGGSLYLKTSLIQLHCDNAACQGIRFFEPKNSAYVEQDEIRQSFLQFICRNCGISKKTYAIRSLLSADGQNGELMKFGEQPPFGPPTPAGVITLIGGEREYFLKGRRAELQGLGIAAFAYYRRVVENQKTRIIEEIMRVAQKLGAAKEVLDDLNAAKGEAQFAKAVDQIKHGIPEALRIEGHNPLTLLHSALSEGLHAQTDEQCLELATSIRLVLTDLVERMGLALKEERELNAAVNRLLRASAKKT